jgi:hypothetical protein
MLKELQFIRKSLSNKLITNKEAFMMAVFRLPIRIMPKFIIGAVYRFLLRL